MYNNYQISYEELLDKANGSTMNVKRLRFLCVEIYKTINDLNHGFIKQIFELRETNRNVLGKYRLKLNIPNYNQAPFGKKKSLRMFGPKICSNLIPYHIKSSKNLESFKTVVICKIPKPYFFYSLQYNLLTQCLCRRFVYFCKYNLLSL